MSKEEKLARLAALKAKQSSVGAARVTTSQSNGGSNGATNSISNATVKLRITSSPRTINGAVYLDACVLGVTNAGAEGKRMLVPEVVEGSDFALAPMTDERGDYLCKYEDYKKTDERKPVQLAEYGYTTVKITNAPSGPVDWAASPALFPGNEITINGAAVSSVFKQGTLLSGAFVPGTADEASVKKPLDFEMPQMGFDLVANDATLARRNMALSLDTGGYTSSWQFVLATDGTKQFATTTQTNVRDTLLKSDGPFLTGLKATGEQGDGPWKAGVQEISAKMINGAAFQNSGLGCTFDVAAYGPTVAMPIYAIGAEDDMGYGLPGFDGKALGDSDFYFEGALGDPGKKPIFGTSFKAGTERANGGPWLNLHITAFTKAQGAEDMVALQSPVTLKMSLTAMPAHFGSKYLETIKVVAPSFLPFTDMVVAFNTDRNNVGSNAKANETFDCRLPTVAFHSALVKYGIELDIDVALDSFKTKPVNLESASVASTFTSSPKPILACGFALLNENPDARSEDWLDSMAKQMEKILAHANRKPECTIEIRAINPNGFEAHKASLKALEGVNLVDRMAKVGDDWPIYAVLKVDDDGTTPEAVPMAAPEAAPEAAPAAASSSKVKKQKTK